MPEIVTVAPVTESVTTQSQTESATPMGPKTRDHVTDDDTALEMAVEASPEVRVHA